MSETPLADRWQELQERGWLTADAFAGRDAELAAVREVAAGGLGAGRVFDGHRNALERLLLHRPQDVASGLRDEIASGALRLGVWGADPGPGDGPPAVLATDATAISGVKTFCSGAGWLDLAIVLVRRRPDAPPTIPVLVDLRSPRLASVDTAWFSSPVLRESHSHRVVFTEAPVLAVLGEESTLSEEPWISGDALRSSAVWAGAADAIVARMAANHRDDPAASEMLGRAQAIVGTVDAWLAAAVHAVESARDGGASPWAAVAAMRLELTERLRHLLRISAEHQGSRGLVSDDELQEARAGLDVLLLQHRLTPAAVRLGREMAAPSR